MVEEELKELILKRYRTVRNFAKQVGMPETTVQSMLSRGLSKAYLNNVIRIANILDIDVNMLVKGKIVKSVKKEIRDLTQDEREILGIFYDLNDFNKETLITLAYRLKESQDNETVTLIPILNSTAPQVTEMDYYPQPARMGTGQIVEDAIPEKINILNSQVPERADFIIKVVGDSMEPTYHSGDLLFIQKTNVLELGDIGLFNLSGEQMVKEYGRGELISHNEAYPPVSYENGDLYIQGKVLGKV